MKKHIKYRAELIKPFYEEVRITILEQTCTGGDFGGAGDLFLGSSQFTHKGFTLSSYMFAGVNLGRENTVDVKGFLDDQQPSFRMPIGMYQRFKAAVLAYNNQFSKPARVFSSSAMSRTMRRRYS